MQDINLEYARFLVEHAHAAETTRQQKAHAENKRTIADIYNLGEVYDRIAEKILLILNMDRTLAIELCGAWLWITGDTRPKKEELKTAGFRWSPQKKAWFYAGVPSFSRVNHTLDHIRAMYGSDVYTSEDLNAQINA